MLLERGSFGTRNPRKDSKGTKGRALFRVFRRFRVIRDPNTRAAIPRLIGAIFRTGFCAPPQIPALIGGQQQAGQQPLKRTGGLDGGQGFDGADEGAALGDSGVARTMVY